jgi:hypothetical protein
LTFSAQRYIGERRGEPYIGVGQPTKQNTRMALTSPASGLFCSHYTTGDAAMFKYFLIKVRDLLSYAALGFLITMASEQFPSLHYVTLRPRPWLGILILASAFAAGQRLRTVARHSEFQSAETSR